MHVLERPSHIAHLDLPLDLHAFLATQLIDLPFHGDRNIADAFWRDTDTRLFHLQAAECIDTLMQRYADQCQLLQNAPEYILHAPQQHCLVLAVNMDDGGGGFLLFSKTSSCPVLQELGRQAHD
jgi:hypothetical protein